MKTILHRLSVWADSNPNDVAQSFQKDQKWQPITAREYCDRVYWLALFLESRGFTSRDVGAIFAFNCPEWVHLDLAAVLAGGQSAGIYPNSTVTDIHFILNHTESRFLSVQNQSYYQNICVEKDAESLNRLKCIVVFEGDVSFSPKAIAYADALRIGQKLAAETSKKQLKDFLDRLDPLAGAFIIYTSGTTGTPKGVVLSNDNIVYTFDQGTKFWGLKPENGRMFSFLPLCHVAEKLQNIGGGIGLRYEVRFCTQFDRVAVELPLAEPTLLLSVPRLWEKMMEGVMKKVDRASGLQKYLAQWAMQVGKETMEFRLAGRQLSLGEKLRWNIADILVLSKMRKAMGLGQAEVLVSGAAPLPAHVCRWFRSLGLEILEVFGQTESTGVICITQKGVESAGTVGKPVPGMEIKIAEDGEILTRGRHVFSGYFKNPEATAAALTNGWLRTGDLGEVNLRGLLEIKGRKKEVMKTSGGKMVAPLPIEEALKVSPMISQVCMVGDGRKYLSALITLTDPHPSEEDSVVVTHPQVVTAVKRQVDQLNQSLANYAQIKKFAILAKEFSVAEGEMTPTLKMKRNVIENHYQGVIQSMYES